MKTEYTPADNENRDPGVAWDAWNAPRTPEPYRVVKQTQQQSYETGAAYRVELWARDGEQPVALLTDETDAEFVARAVNGVDAVLKTGDALLEKIGMIPGIEVERKAFIKALQAIAKAEGK